MTNPILIYAPVWPDIAPWAVRITATHGVPLLIPPAPKRTWATEEVRRIEIQRLLTSFFFTVIPMYEVPLEKSQISLLEDAIDVEWGVLGLENSLEQYQSRLRKIAKLSILEAVENKELWMEHGVVVQRVRPLAELCYMEVFRRLPEHRRLAVASSAIDPIKRLITEAIAEDKDKKQEEETKKRPGPPVQDQACQTIKRAKL